jgi:DNA-binding NarL/FixJ family response regulator
MKTKINVLLVDDSELIISGLTEMLSDVHCIAKIKTAGTLAEATEVMNHEQINTVVLDINLPDGNGLNFLKWIKTNHPGVIVMMLSNMASELYRRTAEQRGADHFFDKSNDFEIIHKLLQSPCDNHNKEI